MTGEEDSASSTPVELDPHAPGGAQRVDAGVGVAGVDEDLLVLLEPGVQRVPLEPRRAGQALQSVVAVDAQRARAVELAGPQAVAAGGAAAQALGMVLVEQQVARSTSAIGM